MLASIGFGRGAGKDGLKYEDLPNVEGTHVVTGKNGPITRRGGDTKEGRLRQIENRAAAAQQR